MDLTAILTGATPISSTTRSRPTSPGVLSPLAMPTTPPPQDLEPPHTTSPKTPEPNTADLLAKIHRLKFAQNNLQAQLQARVQSWGAYLTHHAEELDAEIQYWTQKANSLAQKISDRDYELDQHRARARGYENVINAERARLRAKEVEVRDLEEKRDVLLEENEELREKVEDLERQKAVLLFRPSREGHSREYRD